MEDHKNPNKRDHDAKAPRANDTMPLDIAELEEIEGETQRVVFEQDDRFDFSDDDDYGDVDDMFK